MRKNAKKELLSSIDTWCYGSDRPEIEWAWVAINDVYRTLPINHTTQEFVDFIDWLDVDYNAKSKGDMKLEGVVVFEDGSWLERTWEIDNEEYWIPRQKPNINDDFFFLETDERYRWYKDFDGV